MDAVDRSASSGLVTREIAFGSDDYISAIRLRDAVLRRPLGMTLSVADVQGEENQVHFATFDGDILLATCTMKPVSTETVKLRQMAVAADRHGLGLGRTLIRFAEDWAVSHGFHHIQMNARMTAKVFYERLGYEAEGETFLEITIPHLKMLKTIKL